jgi:F-type H+-transporting ATPase subunit b
MTFFGDPESWVLISFILFLGVLVYLKVPGMMTAMLDDKAAKISKELDEAKKLREEAAALLSEFQQKRVRAEADAKAIVAQAKTDAQEYAEETRRKLGEALDRRTKQAEDKIAQAEAAALKDVRNSAAELAVAAAESLVAEAAKGAKGAELVAESIAAVKARMN